MKKENENVVFPERLAARRVRGTVVTKRQTPDRDPRGKERAFTLVELLVVVLIIGILAAVALPQYQKAVMKSRFAILKNVVENMAVARRMYYLENNQYPTSFDELSIEMPLGGTRGDDSHISYQWGSCYMVEGSVACTNPLLGMKYEIYSDSVPEPYHNKRACTAENTNDETTLAAKMCQSETGASSYAATSNGKPVLIYFYP